MLPSNYLKLKGFNFLHYLEYLMGSESFGEFAKAYMIRFVVVEVQSYIH